MFPVLPLSFSKNQCQNIQGEQSSPYVCEQLALQMRYQSQPYDTVFECSKHDPLAGCKMSHPTSSRRSDVCRPLAVYCQDTCVSISQAGASILYSYGLSPIGHNLQAMTFLGGGAHHNILHLISVCFLQRSYSCTSQWLLLP
ncbi:hypothetical protein GDO81_007781 [Engystomops pustulosus]|uniref:Uncharacterized protein n=1 Tax=Engystomops pustulosus TaxID=76066 RepID=A0AAV7CAR9_ENGPU|nr:hypothetical protein GDO81_007781 [Engystomops pustulosus]